ncbi:MAG: hypothetical protein IK014_08225 [Lachnospiraceae bacterium]|nr:hypothetical protein [Lachnospiraceae bacterium]
MKGNEGKILLGSLVIAILIVAAAYKFFYLEDMKKMDSVQGEIAGLQTRFNELNEKNANRVLYEDGIAESQDIIDAVLALYGPGNTAEKSIMMIVDLCKKTGISVSNMTFIEDKLVYSSVDESETEVTGNEVVVYNSKSTGEDIGGSRVFRSGLSLSISSGYTQLKKITDYINSYPERMNAESFSVKFDPETGSLKTTMRINLYSVVDKNHVYEAPVIEDIELTNDNIFKTLEPISEEEETEEAGNNEETNSTEENND